MQVGTRVEVFIRHYKFKLEEVALALKALSFLFQVLIVKTTCNMYLERMLLS